MKRRPLFQWPLLFVVLRLTHKGGLDATFSFNSHTTMSAPTLAELITKNTNVATQAASSLAAVPGAEQELGMAASNLRTAERTFGSARNRQHEAAVRLEEAYVTATADRTEKNVDRVRSAEEAHERALSTFRSADTRLKSAQARLKAAEQALATYKAEAARSLRRSGNSQRRRKQAA